MNLDEEIAWWTKAAFATESCAAFVAFGVATGLKLAKKDYGASDVRPLHSGTRNQKPLSRRAVEDLAQGI